HPASVYVGVQQDRSFVKAGEPLGIAMIVTDIDGASVPGRAVAVKSARVDWEYREGEPVEIMTDADTCTVTSGADPVRCSLRTTEGGRYRVEATVTDEHGRRNRTETHVWVMGVSSRPDATLAEGQAQVIAQRSTYQLGENAELLVVSPFWPAEG